ncbi:MarR family transcriptional regulator [Ramlibacter sp. MAH-25]|uniref:MarR family transcriptional regulator n=2 Tax=Comamonadaceae TaxID=80864 RepID=A0A6N8IRD4_9BURK|nr:MULTISPECIES: MarR family winged helix-turn-helix transcriptional regulator [Ramlibacter]MBA2964316.1 winged helix-turn-helix transcriptional regulator [Ramlibacter sp. CGMCC 1.13660]MVQ29282.1 MarR family transcriptional regulator [Ramlibacter pinisoli]
MGTMESTKLAPLDKAELERQSLFRYELRRFLRFGEEASRAAGVTAVQYHLMLHTQGFPGREWASIGELAERLQTQPHGVVALVSRCEEAGLVRRKDNPLDGRLVEVHLTAKGRRCVDKVAAQHRAQMGALAAVIEAASASSG